MHQILWTYIRRLTQTIIFFCSDMQCYWLPDRGLWVWGACRRRARLNCATPRMTFLSFIHKKYPPLVLEGQVLSNTAWMTEETEEEYQTERGQPDKMTEGKVRLPNYFEKSFSHCRTEASSFWIQIIDVGFFFFFNSDHEMSLYSYTRQITEHKTSEYCLNCSSNSSEWTRTDPIPVLYKTILNEFFIKSNNCSGIKIHSRTEHLKKKRKGAAAVGGQVTFDGPCLLQKYTSQSPQEKHDWYATEQGWVYYTGCSWVEALRIWVRWNESALLEMLLRQPESLVKAQHLV